MKFCKKYWLKYQIRKYERFLLEEGVQEAARSKRNILIGLESKAIISDDSTGRIYLPQNEQGQTEISRILALGAENHPEEARRYVVYQKMLRRLER